MSPHPPIPTGETPDRIPTPIFIPVVMTVLLFVMTIFMIIIPLMESKLMDGKREMIRELVESAWSSLAIYAAKEDNGILSRAEAQAQAIAHVRGLRYGQDHKDYFWINDMLPRIVMHPYRTDLEGQDISGMTDPAGKRIFVETVKTVEARGAGFVDYQWQWMDNPNRIVPKISYVKGFAPWGWIIGTGIYVEDVRGQISAITRNLMLVCVGILVMIIALSAYAVWHGAKVTRDKERAEGQVRLRQEQLYQAAKMVSLGTLVSGVAHEINNPITSIMLNAPTLDKLWAGVLPVLDDHYRKTGDFAIGGASYAVMRDRIPQMLANIGEDARRVRDIVNDLKDFARQHPSAMRDEVDLNEVVGKALGLAANLIKKSTNRFKVSYAEQLPCFLGNAQRIEQVVINLVVNACQALPDNTCAIKVVTAHAIKENAVTLEVHDEGVGIEAPVLRQLTDPFFTTKRDSGGTGLGLAISDRIVRDHGGTIEFQSIPRQGTSVRVQIPLMTAANNSKTPKEAVQA